MGRNGDELANRRSARHGLPAPAYNPTLDELLDVDESSGAEVHLSTPDVMDAAASDRDVAAAVRDEAAARRDADIDLTDVDRVALDRMLAARDRAAAALDREEAALDRRRAGDYLQRTYRDDLTGALQRAAGMDQLKHEIDRAHRTEEPLVVAFIDVVNLKGVNDTQGHPAGDRLLSAVGRAIREGLRSYDIVIRYGGDEFVCALPRAHIVDAARRFVEVGRLLIESSPEAAIRVGLAQLNDDDSLAAVIERADRELYVEPTVLGNAQPSRSPRSTTHAPHS